MNRTSYFNNIGLDMDMLDDFYNDYEMEKWSHGTRISDSLQEQIKTLEKVESILNKTDSSSIAGKEVNLSPHHEIKDWIGADLSKRDLSHYNFKGADLEFCDMSFCNLRDANFFEANLSYADLKGANLTRADLRHADLRGTDLTHCQLSQAKIEGIIIDADTKFSPGTRSWLSRELRKYHETASA